MAIAVGLAKLTDRKSGPEPLTVSAPAVIVVADSMMRSSPAVALARLTAAPDLSARSSPADRLAADPAVRPLISSPARIASVPAAVAWAIRALSAASMKASLPDVADVPMVMSPIPVPRATLVSVSVVPALAVPTLTPPSWLASAAGLVAKASSRIAPSALAVLMSISPSLVAVPAVTVRLVPACAVSSWVEPVLVMRMAPAARISGRLAAVAVNPPSPVMLPPLAASVTLLVLEVNCPARMFAPAVSCTSVAAVSWFASISRVAPKWA